MRRASLLAVFACLAVAGCGGGGTSTQTTTEPPAPPTTTRARPAAPPPAEIVTVRAIDGDTGETLARAAAQLPVRRVGTAGDVAQAYLLAMTNPSITGAVLDVDGGALL